MQQRRIIRARDLAAFREALIELSLESSAQRPRHLDARNLALRDESRSVRDRGGGKLCDVFVSNWRVHGVVVFLW